MMDWGIAKRLGGPTPELQHVEKTGHDQVVDTAHLTGDRNNLAANTADGTALGTFAYMAPEQARGELHKVDLRTDVFALGGMLCVILTGQPPYTGSDPGAVFMAAQTAALASAITRLRGCGADHDLVELATACLSVDPAGRPADAGEVAARVRSYLDGVANRARQAEIRQAATEAALAAERRRRRVQVTLAATVLLFALCGVGVAAGGWRVWQREAARQADLVQEATRFRTALETGLGHADNALRAGKLEVASSELDQLKSRLKGVPANDLTDRTIALSDDLALAGAVERVRDIGWLVTNDRRNLGQAASLYESAFDRYFGRPVWLVDEDHIARVKASPAYSWVLTGLAEWMAAVGQGEAGNRLLGAINRFDPHAAAAVRLALNGQVDPERFPIALIPAVLDTPRLTRDQKLALLNAAWRRAPNDFSVLVSLADSYRLGTEADKQLAIQFARAGVTVRPDHPYSWNLLGHVLLLARDGEGAVAAFKQSLVYDPTYLNATVNLGCALAWLGRFDQAVAAYQRAIEIEPTHEYSWYSIASSLAALKRFPEAIDAADRALRLNPDSAPAWEVVGDCKRSLRDLPGAISAYHRATRTNPPRASAFCKLGDCEQDSGRFPEAIAAYERAVSLEPGNWLIQNDYGAVLEDAALLGPPGEAALRAEQALNAFERTVHLNPNYPLGLCNLGRTLAMRGQFERALSLLRRGHELGSKQPNWKRNSAGWVRECEELASVEAKLPAILSGVVNLTGASEWYAAASICNRHKDRFTDAARLFAEAFAKESPIDRVQVGRRLEAAKAAIRAGTGRGVEPAAEGERSRYRALSLRWLKDEVRLYQLGLTAFSLVPNDGLVSARDVDLRLDSWLNDPDFAPVRDHQPISLLTKQEQGEWQEFWKEVRTFQQAVRSQKHTNTAGASLKK